MITKELIDLDNGIDLEEKVPLELSYKILLEQYKNIKEINLDMIDAINRKDKEIFDLKAKIRNKKSKVVYKDKQLCNKLAKKTKALEKLKLKVKINSSISNTNLKTKSK